MCACACFVVCFYGRRAGGAPATAASAIIFIYGGGWLSMPFGHALYLWWPSVRAPATAATVESLAVGRAGGRAPATAATAATNKMK